MLVGGISVGYLLQRGLRPEQLALLKTIQAVILLSAEVPTGILADAFGRRLSLMIAALASATGLLGFAAGTEFWHFSLAETLTALSLCFWSGSFEAFVAETPALHESPRSLTSFFQKCESVSQLSVMAAGLVSGIIAGAPLQRPYFLAAGAQVFLLIVLSAMPGTRPGSRKEKSADVLPGLRERWTGWAQELADHASCLRECVLKAPEMRPPWFWPCPAS